VVLSDSTSYWTFVSQMSAWRLYRGVGTSGSVVAERAPAPPILDLSPSDSLLLWALVPVQGGGGGALLRIRLPALETEDVPWDPGRRLGAVASSPTGDRSIVLEIPSDPSGDVGLHCW